MDNLNLDYDYLAKLVGKAQKGDSNAFAELYTATYKKQYRFTFQYVKDQYLAQDVLQEVYILALRNLSALKNPRLFVSWLNQINFRVCYDMMKKSKAQSSELVGDDPLFAISDAAPGPEQEALRKTKQTELMSMILSLPPREAQTLIMRYYDDMKLEDIAEAMDISRSTVKRQLNQGREHLRQMLEKQGEGGVQLGQE